MSGPFTWAGFAEGIRRAVAEGDASFFLFPPPQGPTDNLFGRAANACGDYVSDIHTYADMQQRIEMGRQLAPHLQGGSETWLYVLCAGWPFGRNHSTPDVKGVPTLSCTRTTTPVSYKWAFGLARDPRQHGSHASRRAHVVLQLRCARTAIDSYLSPAEPAGLVCTI